MSRVIEEGNTFVLVQPKKKKKKDAGDKVPVQQSKGKDRKAKG